MHAAVTAFLENADSTARLMAHAKLLMRLSRRFEKVAPMGLANSARVANYKSGILVIHADNGAVATKLRQLGQRLCNELSKGGPQCNVMEVKVQPRQIRDQSRTSTQKPLSARTFGTLRSTAENLPAGDLRTALQHLLERSAKAE